MVSSVNILEKLYESHQDFQTPDEDDLVDFRNLMESIEPKKDSETSKVIDFNATRYGRDAHQVANAYVDVVSSAKNRSTKLKVYTNGWWSPETTIKLKTKDMINPDKLLEKYEKLVKLSKGAYTRARSQDHTVEYIMGAISIATINTALYAWAASEGIIP